MPVEEAHTVPPEQEETKLVERSYNKVKSGLNWFVTPLDNIIKIAPPTKLDLFVIIFSLSLLVFDVGSDIFLAFKYLWDGKITLFWLTSGFIVIPAIVSVVFNQQMMIRLGEINSNSCLAWTLRLVFSFLQIELIFRYFKALCLAIQSRELKGKVDASTKKEMVRNNALLNDQLASSAFLKVIETFMEAAPQVTLQIFIVVSAFSKGDPSDISFGQYFSIVTSLLSLGWALPAYYKGISKLPKAIRKRRKYTSPLGILIFFISYIFTLSSRVIAVALFACAYPATIFPVCLFHWTCLVVYRILKDNLLRWRWSWGFFYDAMDVLVIAWVNLFTFFTHRGGRKRDYIFSYILIFIENSVFLSFWSFQFGNLPETKYFVIYEILIHYALFFIGIVILLFYNVYFHPSVTSQEEKRASNPLTPAFILY